MFTRKRIWLVVAVVTLLLGGGAYWAVSNNSGTASSPISQNYTGALGGGMAPIRDYYSPSSPLTADDAREVAAPVFNCSLNTGRPRATYADVVNLRPCWNEVFHVTVDDKMVPTQAKYTSVSDGHSVHLVSNRDAYDHSENTGEDHYKFVVVPDNPEHYDIDFYALNGSLPQYELYYRVNNEVWEMKYGNLLEGNGFNTGDMILGVRNTLEVVIVMYNPNLPAPSTPLAVPFDWTKMWKGVRLPTFA